MTLALTIITGLIYPGIITGLAQVFFPSQANGSILYVNGKPIASSLDRAILDAAAVLPWPSLGDQQPAGNARALLRRQLRRLQPGADEPTLITTVQQRIDDLKKENPDVPAGTPIPADLVTASGSGLDPDISVAAAYYQIPRVAKARGMTQEAVRSLVDAHVTGRFLGIFGEPRINVLELNLALDGVQTEQVAESARNAAEEQGRYEGMRRTGDVGRPARPGEDASISTTGSGATIASYRRRPDDIAGIQEDERPHRVSRRSAHLRALTDARSMRRAGGTRRRRSWGVRRWSRPGCWPCDRTDASRTRRGRMQSSQSHG